MSGGERVRPRAELTKSSHTASPSRVNSGWAIVLSVRDLDRVAPGPLGLVERGVGGGEHAAHRGPVPGRLRDAHAEGAGPEVGTALLQFPQALLDPGHEYL